MRFDYESLVSACGSFQVVSAVPSSVEKDPVVTLTGSAIPQMTVKVVCDEPVAPAPVAEVAPVLEEVAVEPTPEALVTEVVAEAPVVEAPIAETTPVAESVSEILETETVAEPVAQANTETVIETGSIEIHSAPPVPVAKPALRPSMTIEEAIERLRRFGMGESADLMDLAFRGEYDNPAEMKDRLIQRLLKNRSIPSYFKNNEDETDGPIRQLIGLVSRRARGVSSGKNHQKPDYTMEDLDLVQIMVQDFIATVNSARTGQEVGEASEVFFFASPGMAKPVEFLDVLIETNHGLVGKIVDESPDLKDIISKTDKGSKASAFLWFFQARAHDRLKSQKPVEPAITYIGAVKAVHYDKNGRRLMRRPGATNKRRKREAAAREAMRQHNGASNGKHYAKN